MYKFLNDVEYQLRNNSPNGCNSTIANRVNMLNHKPWHGEYIYFTTALELSPK
jgi:hypothetical protein